MVGTAAYLESRILSADPVELIAILYEQAILSVSEARECLARQDVAERCRNISKALAIVGELDGSLNHSVGGEMSMNLARLYQYLRERLTAANLMKEAEPLAEVESLLNTMAEAWAGVKRPGAQPAGIPSVPALEATPAYLTTPFIQGTESYQSSHSWTA